MPRATVSVETVRHDLKSCPDGFVELKRLPFGGMLKRRDMSGRAYLRAQQNGQVQDDGLPDEIGMELLQEAARHYEFANCIVDHNLEDESGRKLDFSKPKDVDTLDPRIGQEIEGYIDTLNQELTEEEEGNFPESSTDSSSTNQETTPPE